MYDDNERDVEERRVAAFHRKYRLVKRGYVVAGALFAISLMFFIGGIAVGDGSIGGIGAMFFVGSFVTMVCTGVYHNLSGLWDDQLSRQRGNRY